MKIAVCGNGRSGKTLVSNLIKTYTPLRYHESTSEHAANIVYKQFKNGEYGSARHCWDDRRNHREFWKRVILEHNKEHGLMYFDMMKANDIIDGIRDWNEFLEMERYFDHTIYIDGPYEDESCQISGSDCDFVITNQPGTFDFYYELKEIFDEDIGVQNTFPSAAHEALRLELI